MLSCPHNKMNRNKTVSKLFQNSFETILNCLGKVSVEIHCADSFRKTQRNCHSQIRFRLIYNVFTCKVYVAQSLNRMAFIYLPRSSMLVGSLSERATGGISSLISRRWTNFPPIAAKLLNSSGSLRRGTKFSTSRHSRRSKYSLFQLPP